MLAKCINDAPPLLEAELDGWQHCIWMIDEDTAIANLTRQLETHERLYIADGHHRSAAAARVLSDRSAHQSCPDRGFLAVSFPATEMVILDYNRVVRDLNGESPQSFVAKLERHFQVTPVNQAVRPTQPHEFGLYIDGQWHALRLRSQPANADPVARLDVSILQELVLKPVLAIAQPRTDPRIDFVGGSRGLEGIVARVDSGDMAAGFSLYPTPITGLLEVADAEQLMPPKSTWFEPKLADGLLSLPLG